MNKILKAGFGALALCGAVATANAEAVESSNICGYQHINLAKGWSFFTATFDNIGADKLDIQQITSSQVGGAAWKTSGSSSTKCAGAIHLQKIAADGAYLDQYDYFSTKEPQGWYTINGGEYLGTGKVFLENGEGLVINNTHSVGAELVVSGGVNLEPARVLPKGWSFCGNFTPVKIDIQDITSTQIDGTPWKASGSSSTKCAGAVHIQKITADGAYLDQYDYFSTKEPQGWYTINGGEYLGRDKVYLEPGEGFVVNNTHSVGARLVLPSPIAKK